MCGHDGFTVTNLLVANKIYYFGLDLISNSTCLNNNVQFLFKTHSL